MTKIKYSKSYKNILSIKKDFYEQNELNLKIIKKINKNYKKQKIRKNCIICKKKISNFFIKNFGIEYSLCQNCNHLNGKYQNSSAFSKWLYSKNQGKNYSRNYLKFFNDRVNNIYLPKVNFLKDVIKKKIRVLDYGAGAGHFLKALEISKIKSVGIEPSLNLCEIGRSFLRSNKIENVKIEECDDYLCKINNFNTVSLIGVLEHLLDPIAFIKNFKKSKAKYLYISVPLFSLSVFFENSFTKVFPRHLSGGHTHLFTKESLYFIAKKYNLKIIGEWWFGTDIPDLYRSLLQSDNILNKKIFYKKLNKYLFEIVDDLQNVIDKKKQSSQVHIIFEKIN